MTSFIGWSVEQVATADDAAWESVYIRLHDWATVLRTRGVASLLETVTRHEHLPARVLSREDGERNLTDLLHIGQLLHHEVTTERLGVSALAAWLRARIREAADDVHNEDRSRRLESDSAAVQVLTIHRCKGLEFPIVYCPFLWQPPWIPPEPLPLFHDATAGGRRSIDVGGRTGSGHLARLQQHVAEVQGEALRLAYVALTRARHQAVLHWASTWDSRESPLARLLFASELDADAVALPRAPDEAKVIARLRGDRRSSARHDQHRAHDRTRRHPLGAPVDRPGPARRTSVRARLRRVVAPGVVQQPDIDGQGTHGDERGRDPRHDRRGARSRRRVRRGRTATVTALGSATRRAPAGGDGRRHSHRHHGPQRARAHRLRRLGSPKRARPGAGRSDGGEHEHTGGGRDRSSTA